MRHKLSRRAEADLQEIYGYTLRAFGPRQAEKYLKDLSRTFELIAEYPQSGPLYEGKTRQFLHGSHIILYRVHDEGILIGRIFHGAQRRPPAS
ncbi:MAG TPA: type II toxin-antitoxin system RelE/ParE family toxin [Devosia sp.]|jgi:toxin ParE1/3/4|uniref:type II toxin-antitoxin system RelE/ParE family toxin n=1 Tax=Devosia sp. TaxID=1871048 RepID=UPI002F95E0E9